MCECHFRFLNEHLGQTQFKQPIIIIADKATWKHHTCHFIITMTVVGHFNHLIHTIYVGHPVIKTHNGQSVANSMLSCMSEPTGSEVVREAGRVRIPGKAWMSSCLSLAPPVAALKNWKTGGARFKPRSRLSK